MKILFVDYLSPEGHINFNNIHLSSLLSLGYEVDTAFKKDYGSKLAFKGVSNIEIPNILYLECSNKVQLLFQLIKRLQYVKKMMSQKYDYIIFSSYVLIPHLFLKFDHNCCLINHFNLCYLNKLKLLSYKLLSKKYTHIVFNESMKNFMDLLGLKSRIVRHGLSCHRYEKQKSDIGSNIIFSPTNSMLDDSLIEDLLTNAFLIEFLKANNCILILKGNYTSNNNRIRFLGEKYLTESEYYNYFLNAKVILLPYSNDFKYRVSGPMFDAFTHNIPLAITRINSFLAYQNYFSYNPYFSNVEELVQILSSIQSQEKLIPYRNLDLEVPDWSMILN